MSLSLSDASNLANIAVPLLTIGGGIVVAIVFWTKISDKIETMNENTIETNSRMEGRVKVLEGRVEMMQPIWEEIRGRLIAIETTLSIHFKKRK